MMNDSPVQSASEEQLEELPESEPEPLVDLPQIETPIQPQIDENTPSDVDTVEVNNTLPIQPEEDDDEIVEPEQVEEEFASSQEPATDLLTEEYTLNEEQLSEPVLEEEPLNDTLLEDEQLTEPVLDDELPSITEEVEDTVDSADTNDITEEVPNEDILTEEPESDIIQDDIEEELSEESAEQQEPEAQDSTIDELEEGDNAENTPDIPQNMDANIDELLPDLAEINEPAGDATEDEPQQDNLTEDDLDFIQGMNLLEENTDVDSELDEKIPDEQPQVVPVYPADEMATNPNAVKFEAGDRVSHPKYGEGVVEKMIKYGNKILCSISFENGRRLLDPTISEVKKL